MFGHQAGSVVLGLLWWSWVGYACITSVVDPDEVGVRAVLFAAMGNAITAVPCVELVGNADGASHRSAECRAGARPPSANVPIAPLEGAR